MNRLDKIINEEINRLILTEAVDFTNLKMYSDNLNKSLGEISTWSADKSFDKSLRKFFYDFVVYCVQIIASIDRCMKANNLDEARLGGLSDYGINLPAELGGNLWRDAKEGFYDTTRFFNSMRHGGYGKGSYASGSYGSTMPSASSIPTVKLYVLLNDIPKWQTLYKKYDASYGLSSNPAISGKFHDLLGTGGLIEKIKMEYDTQKSKP